MTTAARFPISAVELEAAGLPRPIRLPPSLFMRPEVRALSADAIRLWLTMLPFADPIGVIPFHSAWIRLAVCPEVAFTEAQVNEALLELDPSAGEPTADRKVCHFFKHGDRFYIHTRFWSEFASAEVVDNGFRYGPASTDDIKGLPEEFHYHAPALVPPKRKRGRPRKKTVPQQETVPHESIRPPRSDSPDPAPARRGKRHARGAGESEGLPPEDGAGTVPMVDGL